MMGIIAEKTESQTSSTRHKTKKTNWVHKDDGAGQQSELNKDWTEEYCNVLYCNEY